MPVFSYFDNLEPNPPDVEIWRFMPLKFYEDLMANQELHFTRADGFRQDEQEGLPPEDYLRLVLRLQRYLVKDESELNHHMGTLSQDRLRYYVLCWHLYRHETVEMWQGFAETGVAIRSRYSLLKAVMDGMLDTTHLGIVRYGVERLHQMGRYNVWQFINTKRDGYAAECEVRAIIEGPFAGDNRHFDLNNHAHPRPLTENPPPSWLQTFKRRRIDVKELITGVVVSPFADAAVLETAKHWVEVQKLSCEVRTSHLTVG